MRQRSHRNLGDGSSNYTALVPKEEEKNSFVWDDIDYLDQVLSPRSSQMTNISDFNLSFDGGPPKDAKQIEKEARDQLLESYRERIKQIRSSNKSNSKCADCPTRYPPYTVINFGTFICAKCSMHHKKIGHRVKSINLDDFNEKDVKLFEQIGNKNSNKKYQLNHDETKEYDEYKQLEFIKKKYKKRKPKKHKQNKSKIKSKPDGIFNEYDPFNNITENNNNNTDSNNTDNNDEFDGPLYKPRTNNMSLPQSETMHIVDGDDTNHKIQNKNDEESVQKVQPNIIYDINDNDDPFGTESGDDWNF